MVQVFALYSTFQRYIIQSNSQRVRIDDLRIGRCIQLFKDT